MYLRDFFSPLTLPRLQFMLGLHFTPGPQSAVRSPQSTFYTDRKRNRRIPSTSKQLPSYNQIHTRLKYQKQRLHSWTRKVRRFQIQQGFYPWSANTLQANRNIPIHESVVFVSPTRRHKRLHHFWREHEEFFNTPQEWRLPSNNCRKTSLRGHSRRQKESTRTL